MLKYPKVLGGLSQVRIAAPLLNQAKERARDLGWSLSSFIRHALTTAIWRGNNEAWWADEAKRADPHTLMTRAAFGDLLALREASARILETAGGIANANAFELAAAVALARLAAAHGDSDDEYHFALLLYQQSQLMEAAGLQDAAAECAAVAVARLDLAADQGDDTASRILPEIVSWVTPETARRAVAIRAGLDA